MLEEGKCTRVNFSGSGCQLGSADSDAATPTRTTCSVTQQRLNWAAPLQTLQHVELLPESSWFLGSQLGSAASDAATPRSSSKWSVKTWVSIGQRCFRRCNLMQSPRTMGWVGLSQLGSAASDAATSCNPPGRWGGWDCLNWAAPLQTLQLLPQKRPLPWARKSQLGSAASDAATRERNQGHSCSRVSIGQRRFRRCNSPIFHLERRCCNGLNWAAPLQTLQREGPHLADGGSRVSIGQRRFRRCNSHMVGDTASGGPVSIGQRRFRRCNLLTTSCIPKGRAVSIGQRRFRRCNVLGPVAGGPFQDVSIGQRRFRRCNLGSADGV